MMTKYALLYDRLNIAAHEQETVVAHYTDTNMNYGPFEYIPLALNDAVAQMIAQGWRYASTAGPQSILMQHE